MNRNVFILHLHILSWCGVCNSMPLPYDYEYNYNDHYLSADEVNRIESSDRRVNTANEIVDSVLKSKDNEMSQSRGERGKSDTRPISASISLDELTISPMKQNEVFRHYNTIA